MTGVIRRMVDVDRWRRRWVMVALLGLCVMSSAWLATLAAHSTLAPRGDYGGQLFHVSVYYHVLISPLPLGQKLVLLLGWRDGYPPFTYFATSVVLALFGCTPAVARAAIPLVFTPVLLVGTYLLARSVGGRMAGLGAAALVALQPIMQSSVLGYLTDYPLAAVSVLALGCLARSDGFRKRGWTLAAGLVGGLGMLTRISMVWLAAPFLAVSLVGLFLQERRHLPQLLCAALMLANLALAAYYNFERAADRTFAIFVLASVAIALASVVVAKLLFKKTPALGHLMEAVALGGALCAPWFLYNAQSLHHQMQSHHADLAVLGDWRVHLAGDLSQMQWHLPVLSACALGVALTRPRIFLALLPTVSALAVYTWLTVTGLPSWDRYAAPMLPLYASLAASLARVWPPMRWSFLVYGLAVFSLLWGGLLAGPQERGYIGGQYGEVDPIVAILPPLTPHAVQVFGVKPLTSGVRFQTFRDVCFELSIDAAMSGTPRAFGYAMPGPSIERALLREQLPYLRACYDMTLTEQRAPDYFILLGTAQDAPPPAVQARTSLTFDGVKTNVYLVRAHP